MVWLFAAVIILFLIIFPGFRKFTLIATGAIVLIGGLALYMGEKESEKKKHASLNRIKNHEIVFNRMELFGPRPGMSSWTLVGRVENKSDAQLSTLKLKIQLKDCPSQSEEECKTYHEELKTIYVSVPPGQVRDFNETFYPKGGPAGRLAWEYQVVEIQATVN